MGLWVVGDGGEEGQGEGRTHPHNLRRHLEPRAAREEVARVAAEARRRVVRELGEHREGVVADHVLLELEEELVDAGEG